MHGNGPGYEEGRWEGGGYRLATAMIGTCILYTCNVESQKFITSYKIIMRSP